MFVCLCVCVCMCVFAPFSYQYVRLDGSMSIKKRQKMVDRFNDPLVSACVCGGCICVWVWLPGCVKGEGFKNV